MDHITHLEPALNPSDHDLLLRIDERTSELWRVVVKGNGEKALIERVSGLERIAAGIQANVRLAGWLSGFALAVAGIAVAIVKR